MYHSFYSSNSIFITMNKESLIQRKKDLTSFLRSLKLPIKDFLLFDRALTHASYIKQHNLNIEDNERLEFFGDAVLKFIVSEYLMENFSAYPEGKLSKLRAFVVSEKVLADIANKLDLKKYILVGKNERKSFPVSILADSLEAVIAVIYYDCGVNVVRDFICKYFKEYIELAGENTEINNFKAVLQEYTQKYKLGLPVYKSISETGPEHNKEFEVVVLLNNNELAHGVGKSKKEASQSAAKNALEVINKKIKL